MPGSVREMCKMLAVVEEPAEAESAGTKTPPSRNCLMFERRRSDEAEGDRRMIGSGLRPGFFRLETRAVLFAVGAVAGVGR